MNNIWLKYDFALTVLARKLIPPEIKVYYSTLIELIVGLEIKVVKFVLTLVWTPLESVHTGQADLQTDDECQYGTV